MKIILAKEQSSQFSLRQNYDNNGYNYNNHLYGVASILAEIKPSSHSSEVEKQYCASLAKKLKTLTTGNQNSISVTLSAARNVGHGSIKIEGGILSQLASVIKKEPEIKVKIKNFHCTKDANSSNSAWTLTSYCKKLQDTNRQPDVHLFDQMDAYLGCQSRSNALAEWTDEEVVFPTGIINYWRNGWTFKGDVSVVVILNDAIVPKPKPKFVVPQTLSITKKILAQEIESDMGIVASNGIEIKCHKTFLAAHSAVLQAMLRSELSESKSSKLRMVDMTEKSVKAFLAYLYYWDISVPNDDPAVAYELLHAGHKYDIGSLEDAMTAILLEKNITWYTVEAALRLFLFVRNLNKEDLKMTAIKVLKTNFSTLEASKGYQDIFKRDPTAAMELCKYAFST